MPFNPFFRMKLLNGNTYLCVNLLRDSHKFLLSPKEKKRKGKTDLNHKNNFLGCQLIVSSSIFEKLTVALG